MAKALDSELCKNGNIIFTQWRVLITLKKNQDGLTQKEIADKLGLESLTLIPIIDRLESDRLVERRVNKNDIRNNKIYRTQTVDTIWDKTIDCVIRILQLALANIPKTRARIYRSFGKNVD